MTIEAIRTGWLPIFQQMRKANNFLSRQFTMKPGGNYKGGKVAVDIERSGEDVAIAITKCSGPNLNDIDEWTTKEFEPPAYGEAFPVDVCDLITRMAGVDQFTDAYNSYVAQLMAKVSKGFIMVDEKIRRAVELQASQILQTGQLNLTNSAGDTVYSVDFKPKATHFPTVGASWSSGTSVDAIGDLESLASVIRADGKVDPDQLIFGKVALENFLKNDVVKERLDNRRYEVGTVAPEMTNSGATFYGYIWIGTYRFEMWTYPDTYKDPATGNPLPYIADDLVVMKSSRTRLDMTSAEVPVGVGPDPRVANLMPGRMTSRADGFDVFPNIYATPNGKQIMGELESRPLLIPVQIDGFGCLDTEV